MAINSVIAEIPSKNILENNNSTNKNDLTKKAATVQVIMDLSFYSMHFK